MASFTSKVKEELAKIQIKNDPSALSELAGIIHCSATVTIGRGGVALRLVTENKNTVNLIFALVRRLYKTDCELSQTLNQMKKEIYRVTIRVQDMEKLFNDLAVPYGISFEVNTSSTTFVDLTSDKERQISYLRGCLVGNGVITDPEKQYHLQINVSSLSLAEKILEMLNTYSIKGGITERKTGYIVYIKEAQGISDLLTLTGAYACVLDIEDIRLTRELRNTANRQVNFENANIDKTVESAMVQIQAIRLIEERKGLDFLSPSLREAAEVRLNNPESPLSELASLCGGISKSGMNNRIRKIVNIADQLR